VSGIDDEDLRAMLSARADRLAPNAAGEVLASVREGTRRPNRGAAFAVLPVLTGRSPAVGAGWAAAAMIAVLVMAVLATRPPAASPSPSAPSSAAVATATSSLPPGITRDEAIQLASEQVAGGFVSAEVGPFSELDLQPGSSAAGVKPNGLVWAVTFEGFVTTCPHDGSACSSPRQETTVVYLDDATGALLLTEAQSATASPTPPLTRLSRREAVQLALPHVPVSPDPLTALVGSEAGLYRDLAVAGAVGPVPPIAPSQLVWAVTFDVGAGHDTVFVDDGTGAFLGVVGPSVSIGITLAQLGQALGDGSLDGRLLLVDSTLTENPPACGATASCVPQYSLRFLGNVVTDQRPGQPVVPARPDPGSTPLAGTFAVVPYQGTLILAGRVEGSLARPVAWTALVSGLQPAAPAPELSLHAVLGYLTPLGGPCASAECPSAGYELSQDPSARTVATQVRLVSPALGIGDPTVPVAGPLLVRTGGAPEFDVVGRYDVSAITTVEVPTVSCDLAPGAPVPPCDVLAVDAEMAVPAGDAVTAIEVVQGAYCPSGVACPTVESDHAHAIVHSLLGDWIVEFSFDASGKIVSAVPAPLPSSSLP
jgi:hypothetical protein